MRKILMIIESVRLQNIRSYSDETVKFPAGSVLLEGDIGCGKSSILLAIDFALFGLRTGELSGAELLRHGKSDGKITLNMRLGGACIEICRTLERKSDIITQSAGHLIVDGVKYDLMGFGLRSYVFQLLGYPAQLLRKNKSLLYRYTVYTPQEQMKAILLIPPEERMSIMRHVFGIDRYRRLRANATIIGRKLKQKMERYSGIAEGLDDAEKQKEDSVSQKEKILEDKGALAKKVKSLESEVLEKKKMLVELEKEKEKFQSIHAKIEVSKSKKAMLERQLALAEKEILRIKARQKEIFPENGDGIEKRVLELEKEIAKKSGMKTEISKIEKDLRDIESVLSENGTRKNISAEVLARISKISKCPTCLQEVSDGHKKGIHDAESKKIQNFEKICKHLDEDKIAARKKLEEAKKSLEEINGKESALAGVRASMKEYARIAEDIVSKEEEIARAKKEAETLKGEAEILQKDAEKYSQSGEKYTALRKELDVAEGEFLIKKQAFARLEQQESDIVESLKALEKEILKKKGAIGELEKIRKFYGWLENDFSPLMETIEKHMMGKIHHEFNSIFREWFGMFMDDESLSARSDHTFTPVVEQNGFETQFEHLSGGEKTSVALAYRLTLNRVINSLSDTIKTKDILILDEPTDGFSTEQLDKVRDVLRGLALRQIIIVSHEEKIEGFVDNVIRIEKKNGESKVVVVAG